MIVYDLTNGEDHPLYQELEASNCDRQYDFLSSIIETHMKLGRPYLSQAVLKALNYHAICCLHTNAGEYRPCEVLVGDMKPPQHFRVRPMMDDFVNLVNRNWDQSDPVYLAAFVLWRLNHVHPFINGNGRTARAACYFVLCLKLGGLLPGTRILPELIKQNRPEYVAALKAADETYLAGNVDLSILQAFLTRLIEEQLGSAPPAVPN